MIENRKASSKLMVRHFPKPLQIALLLPLLVNWGVYRVIGIMVLWMRCAKKTSFSETSSLLAPAALAGFERPVSLLSERPSQAISLASYGASLFTTLRISSGEFNGITVISTVTPTTLPGTPQAHLMALEK